MPTLSNSATSGVDPWAIQQRIGTTDARLALNSMLSPAPNLSYISYRSGVMASGDSAGVGGSSHMAMRVQPGTGMQVTVEMGNAVIDTLNQGAYQCCWNSKTTHTIEPSSSTTNRIDRVVARVYDDQNSAIGSPAGSRKFTVEVWKGNDYSGTPQVDALPVTAGWIPLAEVRVNANTSTITTAMITDRRGPGIPSRGGVRPLFGQDAIEASAAGYNAVGYEGAYPGDVRYLHTNGFQYQIYYGKGADPKNSGWRGVHNELVYNANSTLGLTWHMGSKIYRTLCSVTVPYPGTPYMVKPTARVATRMSPDVSLDMRITVDSQQGPAINWESYETPSVKSGQVDGTGDYRHVFNVAPVTYGPFYGTKTFFLSAHTYDNWGANWQNKGWRHWDADMRQNLLQVVVVPSTVQPPNESPNDGSGDDIIDKNA